MTERSLEILQVDAFTRTPFEGNPAGVVLQAEGLSDPAMQRIAREMNLSETAFLLPPAHREADLRIRWFTPAVEVDLCGHATVATFHAGMERGRLRPGRYRMECRSGVLPIDLDRDEDGLAVVSMGLPVVSLETPEPPPDLESALGMGPSALERNLPIAKGGDWLIVPLRGLGDLRGLRPDFTALRRWQDGCGVGAVIVTSTETVEPGSVVHLRMFAPAYGIDEDPVTGSAQGPLAVYLLSAGIVTPGEKGRIAYRAEQGDPIDRPGRVSVEVIARSSGVETITIRGQAVTVIEGTVHLRV